MFCYLPLLSGNNDSSLFFLQAESCDCSGGSIFCGGRGVLQLADTIFSGFLSCHSAAVVKFK